ncbi:MAG: FAD-dependent oxidoreductase, partial [Pseudomonadota bacterium]
MTYDYDLFVIGAGSGGVRAARLTAQLGKKVGIAEQSRVGGTCVIRGCVPKKFMVYGSEFGKAIEDAKGYGWRAENVQFNWADLRDNIAAEVDRLNGIYKNILSRNEVELFETRAVLKDEHTVHLVAENRDVTAEKILIAVGGEPMRDDPVDPDRLAVVSDDLFSLPELPKRLVVAGGGYIAVEFAHIFAGLGTEVTLVYRGQDVLKNFDGDIKSRVKENLKNHGIQYINNTVFA